MKSRYVVCNWDFLGAGDRSALITTAEKLSGQPPILLDMNRMANKASEASYETAKNIAREIRAKAGNDQIIFISSGINHIHPVAHRLKEELGAKWLDIRLDLDQTDSFKNYPKLPERSTTVDYAIGLKNSTVGVLNTFFAKLFNSESNPGRKEITTVPVTPDLEKIKTQSRKFSAAHPNMIDDPVVILLGSYINSKTKREISSAVTQARQNDRPVIFVTSPRTEKQQADIITALADRYQGDQSIHFHRFSPANAEENIYPGVLEFAKDVVVTSDSLTMVSESIAMGKRTHILSTMADRPAYYQDLVDKNLVRLCDKGLDTAWTPSPRPDPFAEIQTAMSEQSEAAKNTTPMKDKFKPADSGAPPPR